MSVPKVTVLMPVYNGEKYLKEGIESILNQSFKDFDFLIIDDGSTDNSANIIHGYKDERIRYFKNENNIGIVGSLNKGLDLARGEYIARMDCDDISSDERLSVQIAIMDQDHNIGASGSYYFLMRGNRRAVSDFPLSNEEIKCFLLFNSPIAHPTAMLRRSMLKKYNLYYSSEYIHAEDYDLWSRISECSELQNSSNKLLSYRAHDKQTTTDVRNSAAKHESVSAIRKRHLLKFGINPTSDEMAIHNIISDGLPPVSEQQLIIAEQWLMKLINTNNERKAFDVNYLSKIILERWLRLCYNYFHGRQRIVYFYKSDLYTMIKLPLGRKLEVAQNLYYSWKRLRIKN